MEMVNHEERDIDAAEPCGLSDSPHGEVTTQRQEDRTLDLLGSRRRNREDLRISSAFGEQAQSRRGTFIDSQRHSQWRLQGQNASVRVVLHVRPNAAKSMVGGEHGGALVVRVVEVADKGSATDAALKAVAHELDIPRRCVRLVSGATSRRKVIDVDCGPEDFTRVAAVLGDLLHGRSD
jgi:uncharacterized protein